MSPRKPAREPFAKAGTADAAVAIRQYESLCVVTLDNPPVNALSRSVREGLGAALTVAENDPGIRAVIIAGSGRGFSAGADVREFGEGRGSPAIIDLVRLVQTMTKPVIAAVHGFALGGGLEIALGCHWRVAAVDARLGLTEVKLGLIPGGGGTQLLPRLVGIEWALRMMVWGEQISGAQAAEIGLVDAATAQPDVAGAAEAFARDRLANPHPVRRMADRIIPPAPGFFEQWKVDVTRRVRGLSAPLACIDAVEAGTRLPLDDALANERRLFEDLVKGPESAAQQYLFFAERAAAQVAGLSPAVHSRAVRRAAVVGAGTMGAGIAMCFANAGIPVRLIDVSPEALHRGMETIRKANANDLAKGRVTEQAAARRLALAEGAIGGAELTGGAEIVVEAVYEDLGLKEKVFADLEAHVADHVILATNTSTLDVSLIAGGMRRPERVVGMHFFSPAHVMRLVEIVRGRQTAPDVLATAIALAKRLGKVPVVVGVCDGFVGNRMLAQRTRHAEQLLIAGALPHEVDSAMTAFGFPMGPFAAADLAGLDVGWRVRQARGAPLAIADAIYAAGRHGQKTGRGYYRYEPSSRTPLRDPEIEALIASVSERQGVTRRSIPPGEIVDRLVLPMINEGARILEEGIAQRSSDIDVIWVHGYGWPVWRGGPMYYAGQIGLRHVCDRLQQLEQQTGDAGLRPAELLRTLAARGETFSRDHGGASVS